MMKSLPRAFIRSRNGNDDSRLRARGKRRKMHPSIAARATLHYIWPLCVGAAAAGVSAGAGRPTTTTANAQGLQGRVAGGEKERRSVLASGMLNPIAVAEKHSHLQHTAPPPPRHPPPPGAAPFGGGTLKVSTKCQSANSVDIEYDFSVLQKLRAKGKRILNVYKHFLYYKILYL